MPANRVASLALDFELSEFGANLSVGERQLLCLARAIARKSRLVLMDEATANVDQKTDRLVQRVLNGGALGGATRITIAHRLGTIAACDAVAVLDDGKLDGIRGAVVTARRRGLELLGALRRRGLAGVTHRGRDGARTSAARTEGFLLCDKSIHYSLFTPTEEFLFGRLLDRLDIIVARPGLGELGPHARELLF